MTQYDWESYFCENRPESYFQSLCSQICGVLLWFERVELISQRRPKFHCDGSHSTCIERLAMINCAQLIDPIFLNWREVTRAAYGLDGICSMMIVLQVFHVYIQARMRSIQATSHLTNTYHTFILNHISRFRYPSSPFPSSQFSASSTSWNNNWTETKHS